MIMQLKSGLQEARMDKPYFPRNFFSPSNAVTDHDHFESKHPQLKGLDYH